METTKNKFVENIAGTKIVSARIRPKGEACNGCVELVTEGKSFNATYLLGVDWVDVG
jgi:hypothetical protein